MEVILAWHSPVFLKKSKNDYGSSQKAPSRSNYKVNNLERSSGRVDMSRDISPSIGWCEPFVFVCLVTIGYNTLMPNLSISFG
ncbi:hypothetical protein CEXT_530611 [Caerostris extrusa]|uniref:Uncharacterized protein n=1 Tax=Caerostris extrusa TaxID=172846 RepID=A0AAV4PEC0_CAEEX|nr:hypothetical protein CEXT_530611 [Caerostris extrusa]